MHDECLSASKHRQRIRGRSLLGSVCVRACRGFRGSTTSQTWRQAQFKNSGKRSLLFFLKSGMKLMELMLIVIWGPGVLAERSQWKQHNGSRAENFLESCGRWFPKTNRQRGSTNQQQVGSKVTSSEDLPLRVK